MSLALWILEVELGIGMPRDPNAASWDVTGSAKCNKEAGHFFTVSFLVLQCIAHVPNLAFSVLYVLTYPIVNALDMCPSIFRIVGSYLLCNPLDFSQFMIDVRASFANKKP